MGSAEMPDDRDGPRAGHPDGGAAFSAALPGLMEHVVPLRRYSRALVGDPNEGDDLVQDTLTRALSRAHLYRPGTNLRAWLFTIMHNVHVNGATRASNHGRHVPLVESDITFVQSATQEDHVALQQLATILRRLPDEQRAVLLLVSMEGLKYQEVAEVLGIPVGTVMSRLSRARQAVRDHIGSAM